MDTRGALSTIVDPPCWSVTPVDFPRFLRHVHKLVPDGSIFRLESGHAPEVESFMDRRLAPYPNEPSEGWLFKTAKVFYMPATEQHLNGLAAIAERYAEPEIGNAIGFYSQDKIIVSWHDLPEDPIYVSKDISEDSIRKFCESFACEYSEER